MKKIQCLFLLVFSFCTARTQPIGILKTKTEIINEWRYITEEKTVFRNEINENKLNVLLIEDGYFSYRFTFNARGICFKSKINLQLPKINRKLLPFYENNFEKYFLGEYKKYRIVEAVVPDDYKKMRIVKMWKFNNNNFSCTIVKSELLDGSTDYFCTGIFCTNCN